METIEATIRSFIYPKDGQPTRDNGFAIVWAHNKELKTFKVKGSMPGAKSGASVRLKGEWTTDSWGKSFKVHSYEEVMPTSLEGVRGYLASGMIKGIGEKLADRIIERFGAETLDIIDRNPSLLREIEGIGTEKLTTIMESWTEQKEIRSVMIFLKSHGISDGVAAKIYAKFGQDSIPVMKRNPYVLAETISRVGFITADAIALKMGVNRKDPERIASAVHYILEQSLDGGNTYLPKDELERQTLLLLNRDDTQPEDTITEEDTSSAVNILLERKRIEKENGGLDESDRIYLPSCRASERGTASKLTSLLASKVRKAEEPDFDAIREATGMEYEQSQKDAIALAAQSPVCIITGGPGTGKTTTMKGVIEDARQKKLKIRLAAPTGRAAKKLGDTVGLPAATIHRMLEYNPQSGGFSKDEGNPLSGDLLVVDESSMIDTFLMNSLLKAVPSGMRVVFVGDVDQLPSVGPGNILRDMIESGRIPTVRLTKVFRQAQDSLIIRNAHAINEGRKAELQPNPASFSEDFCFIERDSTEAIQNDIVELVTEILPATTEIDPKDIQVLAPLKKGALGTIELNRILQDVLNPQRDEAIRYGGTEFRLGDRVMRIKNDYQSDTFNGDMGTVIGVDREERALTVDFNGNTVRVPSSDLDQILPAYATTVHKAQGSEFKAVIMPVGFGPEIRDIHNRNLLYTAITRARKRCILIGDKKAFEAMAANTSVRKRYTTLKERIVNYGKINERNSRALTDYHGMKVRGTKDARDIMCNLRNANKAAFFKLLRGEEADCPPISDAYYNEWKDKGASTRPDFQEVFPDDPITEAEADKLEDLFLETRYYSLAVKDIKDGRTMEDGRPALDHYRHEQIEKYKAALLGDICGKLDRLSAKDDGEKRLPVAIEIENEPYVTPNWEGPGKVNFRYSYKGRELSFTSDEKGYIEMKNTRGEVSATFNILTGTYSRARQTSLEEGGGLSKARDPETPKMKMP